MSKRKLKKIMPLFKSLILPLCIVGIILVFFTATNNLRKGQDDEGLDQLESAIRRACASCYAIEGYYPPTVSYIQDHYGVVIDNNKYSVFYDVFSGNIMPDITVVKLGQEN